ncbi:MAG TPA: hypothetical protein ENK18_22220 [Deltaproteobacteria bacterium]|nr:hypothetical protein [Deltaproteobacteria bacterium]
MQRIVPVLSLAVAVACGSEQNLSNNVLPASDPDLSISGRVCHPETQLWVSNALVYTHLYDLSDVVYDSRSVTSDEIGAYTLSDLVPNRDYEIYVQVGHEIIDKFIVPVGNEPVVLPPGGCAPDSELSVAVVTGAYDDFAALLSSIGINSVKVVDGQVGSTLLDFLEDPANLGQHDVVLFDGGHQEQGIIYGGGASATIQDNLRAYVRSGGVVYATDWSYDVVEQIWPDALELFGDDTIPDDAQVGDTDTITAEVLDPQLASALSKDTLDLSYDLPTWPVIEDTSAEVTIHLQGDAPWRDGLSSGTVPGAPLLVSFPDGDGRVWLSTYRSAANQGDEMLEVLSYALIPAP